MSIILCVIGDRYSFLFLLDFYRNKVILGNCQLLMLMKLKKSGKTIIINSHILNDIERICDRGIIIKNGVQMGVWSKADNNEKSLEEIFLELVGGEAI